MYADVPLREVVDREYVGVSESDELVATVELMLTEDAESALVVRGSTPVGVLTERDVLSLLVEGPDPAEATVRDAMTENIPTADAGERLPAAADRMSAKSARRLVVTEPGSDHPIGILSERDLLATSTHRGVDESGAPEPTAAAEPGVVTAMGAETDTERADAFEDQGICERCGTLSRELAGFNGQLLCTDCLDV